MNFVPNNITASLFHSMYADSSELVFEILNNNFYDAGQLASDST